MSSIQSVMNKMKKQFKREMESALSAEFENYTTYKETHDYLQNLPFVVELKEKNRALAKQLKETRQMLETLMTAMDATAAAAELKTPAPAPISVPAPVAELHPLLKKSPRDFMAAAPSPKNLDFEYKILDFEYDEGDEVEVEFVPAPVVQKKEVICVDETSDVSENDIYTGEDLDEPFEEAEEVVEEQAEVEEEAKVEEETEVEVEEVEEDVEEDVDVEEEAEEEAEEEEVVEEVEQEEVEEQVVEEEVEASDGEAELEVEEFEVDGVVYYTTSTINGIIYNKNNEEVGKIVNGEAEFYEVEEEPATEEAEPAAEEEEDAAEEDGAVEVEEVEINGITYYTTSTTDGMIYNQDDEEVGQYVKGKPKFFKRK